MVEKDVLSIVSMLHRTRNDLQGSSPGGLLKPFKPVPCSVLSRVANDKRELIFTTFSGRNDDDAYEINYGMTAWNVNFVGHLRKLNVTNYLIIGRDEVSCEMTMKKGIPCWQDGLRWQPRVKFYMGRQVRYK